MKILASGTFWAIALFVVAAITVFVIWRQGYRRRPILISVPIVTPLISSASRHALAITVTFNDRPLRDPYLVEVAMDSRSRRDIGSKDFDGSRPLVIYLGATIVEATPISGHEYASHIAIDPSGIRLGPCKIRKGHIARFEFITEGMPKVQCADNPILDVDVRVGNGDEPRQPPPRSLSHPRPLVPRDPSPRRRVGA